MNTAEPPVIFLIGPTAAGKTALACRLAEQFPLGLISVDSALVYRDMDIGTAKPDADTLRKFPHALIDILSPEERYSAAGFRRDALAAIETIRASGRIPLLVGGTMLYFKALIEGLADLPQADVALRAQIDDEANSRGWPALHGELAKIDPETAARLQPADAQRIQRALEVFRLTGRPLSALIAAGQNEGSFPYRRLALGLLPSDRGELHRRIAERFGQMLHCGLIDEVSRLRAKYRLDAELPSMRTVGYRQVWQMQEGLIPAGELELRGIYATRQLAKRQLTWMSNTLLPRQGGVRLDCLAKDLGDRARRVVEAFLDVPGKPFI